MSEFDIAPYFAHLNLTAKQLKRIAEEIANRNAWYGVDTVELNETVTLIAAPPPLSQLSWPALELLKRCRGRVRAFTDSDQKANFQTLAGLGLITEADARRKLNGAQTVDELRSRLKAYGEDTKGNKATLLDRLLARLSPDELGALVADVILYTTTPAGDAVLKTFDELRYPVIEAIWRALNAIRPELEAERPPTPMHVPLDLDGMVTEAEWQELRAKSAQKAAAPIQCPAPHYAHPGGSGRPEPGWERVTGQRMTPEQRHAIIVNGVVAVRNLGNSAFVIFEDRADETSYVQLANDVICEVNSGTWGNGEGLSPTQRQALLALGFQAPSSSDDNFSLDYTERSLDDMVAIIENAFMILGSAPDFALAVKFDAG